MTVYGDAQRGMSAPFPPDTPLDLLTPTPRDTTVLNRCRAMLGEARTAALSRGQLAQIGARTAANFRARFGQEPPMVLESHPELGGDISVKCYPGPVAVQVLDEAIRTVLDLAAYTPPPAPPPAPRHPHGLSERDRMTLDIG